MTDDEEKKFTELFDRYTCAAITGLISCGRMDNGRAPEDSLLPGIFDVSTQALEVAATVLGDRAEVLSRVLFEQEYRRGGSGDGEED